MVIHKHSTGCTCRKTVNFQVLTRMYLWKKNFLHVSVDLGNTQGNQTWNGMLILATYIVCVAKLILAIYTVCMVKLLLATYTVRMVQLILVILDFKLSPCAEYSKFPLGWFPGVWFIYADVSEPSISSIFIGTGRLHTSAYEDGTDRRFRNVGIYKPDAGESP